MLYKIYVRIIKKVKIYFDLFLLKIISIGFIKSWIVSSIRKRFVYKYSGVVEKPRLFWGPIPIINNKYFALAMRNAGYKSDSVVLHFYSINKKEDFDLYTEEILASYQLPAFVKKYFSEWILLDFSLKNYDIFHISYEGLFLRNTVYWKLEAEILHACNKKIVMIPYGGDAFMYSKIKSSSQQHALLINYPGAARNECAITERVAYWQKNADFCVGGGMIDGFSRWDSLSPNFLSIDLHTWERKRLFSEVDGRNGVVNVVHSPNHRGVKGTEFIIQAIEDLKKEGLKVNLILLENKKNDEVKRILLEEADILIEQLIIVGYALSAIEGLAAGLPVVSNLEDTNFSQLFSRYSFLGECPLVSSSPETIKDVLRILITQPSLRKDLGECGRRYASKYHSPVTTTVLFQKIYERLWYNKEVDTINLYHPLLKTSFNNQSEIIKPPLERNKLKEIQ